MERIYQLVYETLFKAKDADLENFKMGFVAGVLIFAILAIILRLIILYICRGDRKSRGIFIPGENGNIIVSSGAVSDLVKGIGNSIKHLEVSKVKLLEDSQKSLYLEVHLVMQGGETQFGELAGEFQSRVMNIMKDKFGSQCVKNVTVYLDKIVDIKGV